MTYSPLKTLFSKDGLRKVDFFRRSDGTFAFEEWHFLGEENTWAPFGKRSLPLCDSLERAEAEARGRVDWLSAGEQADA